jgi:SAM-dependent methyltransferase
MHLTPHGFTMTNELRSNLRESYNRKAHERDSSTTQAWKVEERRHFLTLLQQQHTRTLLELGAGTGRDGQFFQEHDLEVTCIDLSPAMVALCRQKGLTASVMDFGDLHFPASSFEAVYALNSLLHLPKHELPTVLQRIATVLTPVGLFYMGVYGGYDQEGVWPDDTYEPRRFFSFYSDAQLQQVVTQVFDLLSFQRIPLGGESGALHFQSLILQKPGHREDGWNRGNPRTAHQQ